MRATFERPTLDLLRSAAEVTIETRADAAGELHRTVIWIVVDEQDRVFVRSVRAATGRWYREAAAHSACGIVAGENAIPVTAVAATDPDSVAACSRALRAKYVNDGSLRSMLREPTLPTTLLLLPR